MNDECGRKAVWAHLWPLLIGAVAAFSLAGSVQAAAPAAKGSGAAQAYLNVRVNNPLAGLVPGTLGAATVTRAQAAAPYAQFGSMSSTFNNSDSVYHSFQGKFEKRMSGGLNLLVAYTFSKLLSNAPGFAPHWENALREAEQHVEQVDRGLIGFARRMVLPLTGSSGAKRREPSEDE